MAIKPSEIINRKYEENYPVQFEYVIKDLDGPNGETQELRVFFEKVSQSYDMSGEIPTYKVYTVLNDKVYFNVYQMPKRNMSLEMIVATGLNVLRFMFLEEANQKEVLGYTIADITKGM